MVGIAYVRVLCTLESLWYSERVLIREQESLDIVSDFRNEIPCKAYFYGDNWP